MQRSGSSVSIPVAPSQARVMNEMLSFVTGRVTQVMEWRGQVSDSQSSIVLPGLLRTASRVIRTVLVGVIQGM